jgi:thiamine-monophosphate kinase
MFSANSTVSDLSESALIERITHWLSRINPDAPEGIGDDCSVHQPSGELKQIVTSDALVYGKHFDKALPPEKAGAKLINRNLSDIAAMGGVPDRAILNLMFGPDLQIDWLAGFFRGLESAASITDLKIVGGDICSLAPGHFVSVLTILGTAERPLLRHSAYIGDSLFVSGELGGSLAQKHANFSPRLAEGRWLAGSGHCTALMDLTDGLAKDLPSLLGAGQSAALDLESIPIADDAHGAAKSSARSVMDHAFCDGEDYELLFTIRSSVSPDDFMRSWRRAFPGLRISRIGQVVAAQRTGAIIDASDGSALPFARGFEHFRGR